MFSRIRKAVLGAFSATATALGLNYADADWWVQAILVPFVTYLVTYWSRNAAGTAFHPTTGVETGDGS